MGYSRPTHIYLCLNANPKPYAPFLFPNTKMSLSSSEISQQLSIFRSQILSRRFNHDSLRILESVLASNDVGSLLQLRSAAKQLLRSEYPCVIREIASKNVEQQLSALEFLVRAFAIVADIESCLALRYEALLLREHKSTSCDQLQVSFAEWFKFAEQSSDHGFNKIAAKACDNALASLQRIGIAAPLLDQRQVWELQAFERINRLKSTALASAGPKSVRALAMEYLKKLKSDDQAKIEVPSVGMAEQTASTVFRSGIKKHNEQRMHTLKSLQMKTD